ncbi:hypothetical protein S83_035162 [Arachis hypogaea]
MTIDRFSNIAFLPNDIWVAIIIQVASNSIRDVCSLRMTCKAARDAGEADIIHRSVFIPPPHATPWWWCLNPEARRFLDRCMAAGNPELLFREALRELFIRCEVQMPRIEEQDMVCASPRCSTRGHMPLLYDYRRRAVERNSVHAFGGAAHIPYIQCRADYDLLVFINLP